MSAVSPPLVSKRQQTYVRSPQQQPPSTPTTPTITITSGTTTMPRTNTLAIEVCRRQMGCSMPPSPIPIASQDPVETRLRAAIDLFLRSHHTKLTPHSQIELWDPSDVQISTQMGERLLSGEMTLAKAELVVSVYVQAIYVGRGGNATEQFDQGYDEVWNVLNRSHAESDSIEKSVVLNTCVLDIQFYECVDDVTLEDAFDGITLNSMKSLNKLEYVTCGLSDSTLDNIRLTALPHSKFDSLWTSLHFPTEFKSHILGHAQLSMALASHNLHEMNNKLLVIHGPPGSGKTTVCKALAQKMSLAKKGILIEISGARIFSKWFGESAQKLEVIFKDIQVMIGSHSELMFCILIDEVESLASSRSQIMEKNEATDAVRVVNTLLTQLDALKGYRNFVILATSNMLTSIDEAFLDRADEVFEVSRPNVTATYNIIRQSINLLISEGLVFGDTIPACLSDTEAGKVVMEISKRCHGRELSGRALTRMPLMTLAKHQIGSTGELEPSPLRKFLVWFARAVGT